MTDDLDFKDPFAPKPNSATSIMLSSLLTVPVVRLYLFPTHFCAFVDAKTAGSKQFSRETAPESMTKPPNSNDLPPASGEMSSDEDFSPPPSQ